MANENWKMPYGKSTFSLTTPNYFIDYLGKLKYTFAANDPAGGQ